VFEFVAVVTMESVMLRLVTPHQSAPVHDVSHEYTASIFIALLAASFVLVSCLAYS
jgi:hypothetical protein